MEAIKWEQLGVAVVLILVLGYLAKTVGTVFFTRLFDLLDSYRQDAAKREETDFEREKMTLEREKINAAREANITTVIKENTAAFEKYAATNDENTEAIKDVRDIFYSHVMGNEGVKPS